MGSNYDIILIGLVAVFLILRLRAVLGKRTGSERPPTREPFTPPPAGSTPRIGDAPAQSGNAAIAPCAGQFQRLLLEIMEDFLKRNGISAQALLAAPEPLDATCLSYCPRCLSQFTQAQGHCPDCRTVELISLRPNPRSGKLPAQPACKTG